MRLKQAPDSLFIFHLRNIRLRRVTRTAQILEFSAMLRARSLPHRPSSALPDAHLLPARRSRHGS